MLPSPIQLSKPKCELPLVAVVVNSAEQARCELPPAAAMVHSAEHVRCELPPAAAIVSPSSVELALALFRFWERSNCLNHCLRFPGSVIQPFFDESCPCEVDHRLRFPGSVISHSFDHNCLCQFASPSSNLLGAAESCTQHLESMQIPGSS